LGRFPHVEKATVLVARADVRSAKSSGSSRPQAIGHRCPLRGS
jgi:hypothetical protein